MRHWHQVTLSLSTEHKRKAVMVPPHNLAYSSPTWQKAEHSDKTDSQDWHFNQWWHLRAAGGSASLDTLSMADESQRFTFLQPLQSGLNCWLGRGLVRLLLVDFPAHCDQIGSAVNLVNELQLAASGLCALNFVHQADLLYRLYTCRLCVTSKIIIVEHIMDVFCSNDLI